MRLLRANSKQAVSMYSISKKRNDKVVARKKAKLEVSTKRKVRIDRRYRDKKT